jgi:hypothetical protein
LNKGLFDGMFVEVVEYPVEDFIWKAEDEWLRRR